MRGRKRARALSLVAPTWIALLNLPWGCSGLIGTALMKVGGGRSTPNNWHWSQLRPRPKLGDDHLTVCRSSEVEVVRADLLELFKPPPEPEAEAEAPGEASGAITKRESYGALAVATQTRVAAGLGWWANSIFTWWMLSVTSLYLFMPAFLVPKPLGLFIRLQHTSAFLCLAGLFSLFGLPESEPPVAMSPGTRSRLKLGLGVWACVHAFATLVQPLTMGLAQVYTIAVDLLTVRVLLPGPAAGLGDAAPQASNTTAVATPISMQQLPPRLADLWGRAPPAARDLASRLSAGGAGWSCRNAASAAFAGLAAVFAASSVMSLLLPSVLVGVLLPTLELGLRESCAAAARAHAADTAFQAFACYELKGAADRGHLEHRLPRMLRAALGAAAVMKLLVVRCLALSSGLSPFAQSSFYITYGLAGIACGPLAAAFCDQAPAAAAAPDGPRV